MPGRGTEQQSGRLTQLGFDSLAELAVSDSGAIPTGKQNGIATATFDAATFGRGEVRRSAPHRRNKAKKHVAKTFGIKQATLDELFATISSEADILPAIPTGETRRDKQNGQIKQLDFETLANLPSEDGSRVP